MPLFVNGLTHLDASLWCPERGLIGVSWHVDVELDGELGEDGMLFDFGEVKPWLKATIDAGPDHTLLVPSQAPGLTVNECTEGLAVRATLPYPMEIRAPRQAFTLLPWQRIDAERLADHLGDKLTRHAPSRVENVRLRFREEAIDGAAYRYSHGLKHHRGNCQRIAHGHRSRLRVWCDGQRQPRLEAHWAGHLDGRYLVHDEDVLPAEEASRQATSITHYTAPQGTFRLSLPSERCERLPCPTTVEHIAGWLAEQIARHHAPGQKVRVQAFEGIDKGAIAEVNP